MFKPRLRIPPATGLWRSACQSSTASSRLHAAAAAARRQTRSMQTDDTAPGSVPMTHTVPLLDENDRFMHEGLRPLYSPHGYKAVYGLYQQWLIDNMNRLTNGTTLEGKEALRIALITAREPHLAPIFNYASMAHNNHFFMQGISQTESQDPSEHMTPTLRAALESSFGSLETLQRELLLTADRMFGPGFVWLVRIVDGLPSSINARFPFRILTTYLAGSPYAGAHWRRQGADMNAYGGMSNASGDVIKSYFDRNTAGQGSDPQHGGSGVNPAFDTFGGSAYDNSPESWRSPGSVEVVPVLCVNTWEHAWLMDFGPGNKIEYLAKWFNTINWRVVEERGAAIGSRVMSTSPLLKQQAKE